MVSMKQSGPAHPVTAARRLKGWDAGKLAQEAGLDPSTVWRVENGAIQSPRVGVVAALAEALELKELSRLLEPWVKT